jgi:FkbM family methyltransferase
MKNWLKSKLNFNQHHNQKQTQSKNVDDCILALKNFFNEEDINIVFDVGAHEGTLAKIINEEFASTVIYAFEPFPSSYEKLASLAAKNNGNIKAFPYALSSFSGSSEFFVNNYSETNSLLPSIKTDSEIDKLTSGIDKISVQTITLNEFCVNHNIDRIDILKLDTQGSELEVLRGGENLLKMQSIGAIYCEVEFVEIYHKQPLFDEIFQYLKKYNYSLYNFYNLNSLKTGQLAWADTLFLSEKLLRRTTQIS